MNGRICILLAAWIAVGVAFYLGHPIAYTVIVIGLAASIAIAEEELPDEKPAERPGGAARTLTRGQPRDLTPAVRMSRVPLAGNAPHRQRLSAPSTELS